MVRFSSSAARRIGPILLVDDYDDARASLRECLENAGYEVVEAAHGQQALDVLVSQPELRVRLIVLDLQMPVMDGWRLLELMSCYLSLSAIPVIIVTGQEPHLERVRHPNVFSCVTAPYAIDDLVDLIDECMAGARTPTRRLAGTGNDAG